MHKELLREQLKTKLFPHQAFRIRRSIDIENIDNTMSEIQNQQAFADSYILLEKIGEGSHALVYKCQRIQQQKSAKSLNIKPIMIYAVKCYRTDDPEIVNTIIRTFNLQRQLQEIPQVCRAYDLFIDQKRNHHYEVIEYCNLPNLQMVSNLLTIKQKQEVIKQLADIVTSIHQKGICHRDLKPDNILIQIQPCILLKLIDFGVCKRFKIKETFREMWTATGSLFYQAPEIFYGGGYDERVDSWAIGVILYQLLCESLPFYAETISDTIEQITSDDPLFQYSQQFLALPQVERDLIKRLLKYNPNQRLSAEEIQLHPWFDKSNAFNKSHDDLRMKQEDYTLPDRTMSNQIENQFQITDQQVQNLMESFEWGQRIHYKN